MENEELAANTLAMTWGEFGQRVRGLRKARGMTQANLADALSDRYGVTMHQTTVAKIENGTRPTVVHEIWALASVLRVEYDVLMPPLHDPAEALAEELIDHYVQAKRKAERLVARQAEAQAALYEVERELRETQKDLFEARTQLGPDAVKILDEGVPDGKHQEEG